jgi:hypothetical protein
VYETVTVDEAIAKAQRTINLPVILFIIGGIGGTVYVASQKILPYWVIPIGIVLAIGLGWLYWSFMIPKWKVWAFENVRNVHELQKRAVREKLIWAEGSFWNGRNGNPCKASLTRMIFLPMTSLFRPKRSSATPGARTFLRWPLCWALWV